MALVLADRVRETTTTTGTGSVTLGGAYTGFQTFSAGIGNANNTYYTIANSVSGEWEVGIGTYTTSGNTLSRDTVLASSNAGSLVVFTAGSKDVFVTQPAERAVYVNAANTQVSVPQLAATSLTVSGTSTLTGVADFADGTAALPSITNTGDTNTGIFFPAADTIAFTEGGAEAMRIDSSGNVGIGTSTPVSKLQVSNSTNGGAVEITAANTYYLATSTDETVVFQGEFFQNDLSANRAAGYMQIGKSGDFSNNANASGFMAFATRNAGTIAEKMRINSSGNVGIGTTSPATILNAYNATSAIISVDGGTTAIVRPTRYSTDASSPQFLARKARGTLASPTAVATSDNAGGMYIQAYGGTNFRTIARIDGFVDTYTSDTNIAGSLRFYTNTSSTDVTEKMRIDSSGNLLVGDTTYRLSGIAAAGQAIQLGSRTFIGSNSTGDTSLGGLSGSNFTAIYSNGAEKMRIDSSGNVGIGTTSTAGYALAIQRTSDNALMKLTAVTSGGAGIDLINAGGSEISYVGASGNNVLTFRTGGTERMRINSSGNVGIGTTSPGSKLSIAGTTAGSVPYITFTSAFATASYFGVSTQANDIVTGDVLGDLVIDSGNNLLVTTNGNSLRLKIDTSGNLQIPTGAVMPYAPAPAAISAATTLTNANIQGQIISATGTTYTITMPLGTTLETLATWATTNIAYDFFVINTATGIITMAVNTGVTSLGLLTIAAATSAQFRIRRTAANTFVLYRLG